MFIKGGSYIHVYLYTSEDCRGSGVAYVACGF